VEDKWREQKAVGEEAAEQEVDEQGKPLTKKQKQQLKRAAEKERAKQRQAQQDRMEPQVSHSVSHHMLLCHICFFVSVLSLTCHVRYCMSCAHALEWLI